MLISYFLQSFHSVTLESFLNITGWKELWNFRSNSVLILKIKEFYIWGLIILNSRMSESKRVYLVSGNCIWQMLVNVDRDHAFAVRFFSLSWFNWRNRNTNFEYLIETTQNVVWCIFRSCSADQTFPNIRRIFRISFLTFNSLSAIPVLLDDLFFKPEKSS